MRVILNECLPARLKRALPGHFVRTVPEAGWRSVKDGLLLRLAAKSFDVFVTVDKAIEREHELTAFRLGFVVVHARSNQMIDFEPLLPSLVAAVGAVGPGQIVHVNAAENSDL